jgi:hypothetical protein
MAMKKWIPIFWLFCFYSSSVGQEWTWAKSFEAAEAINNMFAAPAANGHLILAGQYQAERLDMDSQSIFNNGDDDIFIACLDASRKNRWLKGLGGSSTDGVTNVKVDPQGNIYVTGYYYSLSLVFETSTLTNFGDQNVFLAKFSSEGEELWVKQFGRQGNTYFRGFDIDKTGNLYLSIEMVDDEIGREFNFLKMSSTGQTLWHKIAFAGESNIYFTDLKVSKSNDRLYIAGGSLAANLTIDDGVSISFPGEMGGFLLSYDLNGQKPEHYVDEQSGYIGNLEFIDSDIYMLSFEADFNSIPAEYQSFLIKMNTNMQQAWKKSLSNCLSGELSTSFLSYQQMVADASGNLVLSGVILEGSFCYDDLSVTNDIYTLPTDTLVYYSLMYLLVMDSSGTAKKLTAHSGLLSNIIYRLTGLGSNNFSVAGVYQADQLDFGDFSLVNDNRVDTFRSQHGSTFIYRYANFFLATFSLDTGTSIKEDSQPLWLYPNPCKDHFYLQSSNYDGLVTQVQIFSTDGKLLSQQNILPMGNSLRVETSALPPGLYIVNVISEGQLSAQRFVKY